MNKPKEFIETLKSYDKDNIPEALLKKLKKRELIRLKETLIVEFAS